MPYGLKYRAYYQTETGQTRSVEIEQLDYSGSVIDISAMSEPEIEWNGSDKKESNIIGAEARFSFLSTADFNVNTLFNINPRYFKVSIKEGTLVLFVGWMQGDLARDIYAAQNYTRMFEVTATDGLGDLADIDIKGDNGIFLDRESINAFIRYSLSLTGLNLNIVTAVDLYDSYMSRDANSINQVTVDPKIWIDEEKTISAKEVLDSFCKLLYCRLFQRYGKWHFVCLDNQNSATIPAYEYTYSGQQVFTTTTFSHRKEIDSNPAPTTTQQQLNAKIVSIDNNFALSRQRPLKRLEITYDYGDAKNEVNGNFFGGSTEGWTFGGGITHEVVSLNDSLESYGLEITGTTKGDLLVTDGVSQSLLPADHLTTSTRYPYDNMYAATFMPVKKGEKVNLSFEYKAPEIRGVKICVAFVDKGVFTEANLFDDLSVVGRDGLGTDGKWYAKEKTRGGYVIRHLFISNIGKDSLNNEIIKYGWETYSISSSDGVPNDGWVVFYIYRGMNMVGENDSAKLTIRNIDMSRNESNDLVSNSIFVLENTSIPFGSAKESYSVMYGEPSHNLNYSYLARLNGSRTNEEWDRSGINPLSPLQAVVGAMYMRQYSNYTITLEGDIRGADVMMGDTFTLSGYAGKVFIATQLKSKTKSCVHNVRLVELITSPFTPNYYVKSSDGLMRFYGGSRLFVFKPTTTQKNPARQGAEDIVGGTAVQSGVTLDLIQSEFFEQDIAPSYEYPTQDPETGEDIVHGLKFNGKGVLITDEAPTFRKVKRNWRRHDTDIAGGTSLDSLFVEVPENIENYSYLNGVDWYHTTSIESMTNIPTGLTGDVYVVIETADKYAKQTIIKPIDGELWYRSKLENGTITEWKKVGLPNNIPQENVINLVNDLLDLSSRVSEVSSVNYLQQEAINNNQMQISYAAQVNNTQDQNIATIFTILDGLTSAQNSDFLRKFKLDGGSVGAQLVKVSGNNQDFEFKRAHGARIINPFVAQAKVGQPYGFNIPIVTPEFIWDELTVDFVAEYDTWLQYNFTTSGGITIWGSPTTAGVQTLYAILSCNGYVSTYPILVSAVADITAATSLTSTLTQNYPPVVALSWVFTGAAPDNFYIYRRANGGVWALVNTVVGSALSYTDSSTNYGTQYDYQIKPYTGTTFGDGSNVTSITTPQELTAGGLYGRYYNNTNLTEPFVNSRTDQQINFDWNNISPIANVGIENYSVRWTGYLRFNYSGLINLRTRSDDGVRVWVNSVKVTDQWTTFPTTTFGFTANLQANVNTPITIEYFQAGGGAEMRLEYQTPQGVWEAVPSGFLVPEIVTGNTLAAPVIVDADAISTSSINIDWTYTGDVNTFSVERSLIASGGIWTFVDYIDGANRTYNVTGLSENVTYYFRVRANFAGRESAWSNVMGATTAVTTITPPTFVKDKRAIGWMSPSFNWTNFSANDGIISRATDAGVSFATIFIDWWEVEQGNNSFNFDELKWRIEKQREKGLGFVLVIPHRYAYVPLNNNPEWQMISGSVQHRWNGSTWSDSFISASSCAYMSYKEAEVGISADVNKDGYMLDGILGAIGSQSSATYMNNHRRWIAKVSDYIYRNYSDICFGMMYADGGSTETGFATTDRVVDFNEYNSTRTEHYIFAHGDYSFENRKLFTQWLKNKYNYSDAALSASWGVQTTLNLMEYATWLYTPDIPYAEGDKGIISYNQKQSTWDWFLFRVQQKRDKYNTVIQAVKNPSSVDGSLINPTSALETVAYLTESLTTAQGYTWAAAAVEMLNSFDQIWSSTGSDGAAVGSDSHYKSFALRAAVMRGTLPSKTFAQEMDTETAMYSDGGVVSPSKTMRATFAQGATYFIITFFRSTDTWDNAVYLSEDGQVRSFKDDVKLGYLNHVAGKSRTLPNVSQTLQYDYNSIRTNVGNPNNVVSGWLSTVNPSAAGLSSTYVDIKMTNAGS